jgi:membrane associated rhomboid family serine protease
MEDIEFESEEVEVHLGKITTTLILVCIIVYFTPLNDLLAPIPFISSVVHGSFFHLFYNMLNLFIFGNLIELRFGHKLTSALLVSSIAASDITFRLMYSGVVVVGISDYIYALIAAAFVLAPKAKVLFPIGAFAIPMPVRIAAPFMALGEFILNFVAADNVAHISHFAGFIAGAVAGIWYHWKNPKEEESDS